jgi:hyaluronoglucosaminidase
MRQSGDFWFGICFSGGVRAFEHRGVVEGFYGPPWSHRDRLWMLERLGHWGMNRYVYAPKDDLLHREQWREPYPRQAMSEFAELVEGGAAAGVEVGFAISPGLSIAYSSAEDRRVLVEKFETFRRIGVGFVTLALDDVPTRLTHQADRDAFESLAHAHVAVTRELHDALGPEVPMWVVPTDYLGIGPTDYLSILGEQLDPAIEIGWTGRTLISPTIEAGEAALRAATLKRRLLIWDNVPTSDGPMRCMLHLGPYAGRDSDLGEYVSGILLNPMRQARASSLCLHTAAAYLRDPEGYDPEQAWCAAVDELGEGDAPGFRRFAEAHRFSPLWPEDRDRELEACFAELGRALEHGEDFSESVLELCALCKTRLGVAASLREKLVDRGLVAEIEPWLESHELETRRMLNATDALLTICRDSTRSEKVYALLRLEAQLTRDASNGKVSYGPRRVFYPQLTSMREDEMGLTPDGALIRDRSLVEDILVFVEDLAAFLLSEES